MTVHLKMQVFLSPFALEDSQLNSSPPKKNCQMKEGQNNMFS
jgi:hypothetical protein